MLVAPSTAHDSEPPGPHGAGGAAEEPVRVVATTNRVDPQRPIEIPDNAVLVDWLSYSQLMPTASWSSPTAATAPSPAPSAPAPRS